MKRAETRNGLLNRDSERETPQRSFLGVFSFIGELPELAAGHLPQRGSPVRTNLKVYCLTYLRRTLDPGGAWRLL